MSAQTLLVDGAATTLTLRTRAEGLLARLAHDLQILGTEVSGKVTRDGDAWTAELSVPVASLRVDGVIHGDTLDHTTLSASDRAEIEQRMRADVFFGGVRAVTATAHGASLTGGEAVIALGSRTQRAPVTLRIEPDPGSATRVTGRLTLSLQQLGVKPIKAPLGAFRVKDAVEVLFDVTLSAG